MTWIQMDAKRLAQASYELLAAADGLKHRLHNLQFEAAKPGLGRYAGLAADAAATVRSQLAIVLEAEARLAADILQRATVLAQDQYASLSYAGQVGTTSAKFLGWQMIGGELVPMISAPPPPVQMVTLAPVASVAGGVGRGAAMDPGAKMMADMMNRQMLADIDLKQTIIRQNSLGGSTAGTASRIASSSSVLSKNDALKIYGRK